MSTGSQRQFLICPRLFTQSGFTLIELLLALAIAATLAGLASPVLQSWVDSARVRGVQQQISSLLSEARFRALSRAETLTVCHLEANQCAVEFGFPLSVFIDADRDAVRDSDEVLLREVSADIPAEVKLDWNRSGGYLRFWPSGGTGALSGSINYCDADSPGNNFRIVVARTGRLRLDKEETRCN